MGWTSIGLVALGLLLFFVLAFRRSYRRHPAVEHYRDARDELSGVEIQDDESEEAVGGGFNLLRVISLVVAFVFFFAIGYPIFNTVLDEVCSTAINTTSSVCGGSAGTILDMLPTFVLIGFVLAIVTVGFGLGPKD